MSQYRSYISPSVIYEESVWKRRTLGLQETVAGRWKARLRFRLSFLRLRALCQWFRKKSENRSKSDLLNVLRVCITLSSRRYCRWHGSCTVKEVFELSLPWSVNRFQQDPFDRQFSNFGANFWIRTKFWLLSFSWIIVKYNIKACGGDKLRYTGRVLQFHPLCCTEIRSDNDSIRLAVENEVWNPVWTHIYPAIAGVFVYIRNE